MSVILSMSPKAAQTTLGVLNHTLAHLPPWEDMDPNQRHNYEWLSWLESRIRSAVEISELAARYGHER